VNRYFLLEGRYFDRADPRPSWDEGCNRVSDKIASGQECNPQGERENKVELCPRTALGMLFCADRERAGRTDCPSSVNTNDILLAVHRIV